MPKPRVYFLGAGIATQLGTGIAKNISALRLPPAPPQAVTRRVGAIHEVIPYKLLANFPLENEQERLYRVIEQVIEQALAEAQFTTALTERQRANMGLFIGSSSFDISVSEALYQQEYSASSGVLPLRVSSSFGNLAEVVRARFGLRGPDYSFNTACTSSANALWYASRLIDAGEIEHALVLGVELINNITALGFQGLGLLTSSVMKPFDKERDGLVLGEAASALVIGKNKNERNFYLSGGANSCDTHSMSAANPDGSTVALVIEQALREAGINKSDITAIKAHGTASLLNDEAEAAGLLRIFSAEQMPPVCALKPFIGHTLGACGLTELILFWKALEQGLLIATPGIGADCTALGISLNQDSSHMPVEGKYLLNYFGFGGNNTALVIGKGGSQ